MAASHLAMQTYFGDIPEFRRAPRHRLLDILVMAMCAVIAGANDWPQVVTFAVNRRDWLARFLELPEGIPSQDTFERVFARLKPRVFEACFRRWMQALAETLGVKQIAIDGKSLRGSARRGLGPLHLVSAWASQHHLSLGQVVVDSKSNEITAIPRLLDLLDVEGAFVTIDAMGCQKTIAQKIVDRKGHYALTVKGNQENLYTDIQQALIAAYEKDFKDMNYDTYEKHERGHGRDEYRSYGVLHHTEGIRGAADWAGLTTIGMCISRRTVGDKVSEETRYFIGSKVASARVYGQVLRRHWGIENNLHWQLDVTFAEDRSRLKDQSAENFSVLRKLALVLLKRHPDKASLACKRFHAAMDVDFLEEVIDQSANL